MELISIDKKTVLAGLDEDSIRQFAENEAALISLGFAMGGGQREEGELQANVERFAQSLPEEEAEGFMVTFNQAYTKAHAEHANTRLAYHQRRRKDEFRRVLIFWGPVAAAIALYFIFKH